MRGACRFISEVGAAIKLCSRFLLLVTGAMDDLKQESLDMQDVLSQDVLSALQESEHQAALQRMMCSEPIIIQENERICVVKECGPARTFTAM